MEDCRFFWNILGMLGLALPLLVLADILAEEVWKIAPDKLKKLHVGFWV